MGNLVRLLKSNPDHFAIHIVYDVQTGFEARLTKSNPDTGVDMPIQKAVSRLHPEGALFFLDLKLADFLNEKEDQKKA